MIDVIFEDARCVVVNKPSGLLSVPGRGDDKQDCAARRAQALYPDALIVHRLDQGTSGLLLFARGPQMQRALSIEFAERRVSKRYIALVEGHLKGSDGAQAEGWQEIDLPLIADWPNRPRQKVDPAHGKPARTRWRVLSHEGALTRVELEPVTGRSHQLRVHLQSLGHPIAGDALYGHVDTRMATAPRLMLHACALAVPRLELVLESEAPF